MIEESSTSRDSKRSQNGFPLVSNPDATSEYENVGVGPSNEPPPPTYEEAVSTVEASCSASMSNSASSGGFRGFAPSRSSSKTRTAASHDKYAPQTGATTLSPYANPGVTGYGVSTQTLSFPEAPNLGRHPSVASYYAPSTSSGKSRVDPGFASPSTASSSYSGDNGPSVNVARSCSTSTTTPRPRELAIPHSRPRPQIATPLQTLMAHGRHRPSTRAESFARAPANDLPYGSFPPATLHAHSGDLEADGFPKDPPTCACAPAPHPFVTHDVNEEDWASFLDDVRAAGGLSPVNSVIAGAAPIAVRVGIIGGLIAGHALRAHVKSKRKSPLADVIDEWNRKFFHPRCMDVVLAQGMLTYSGPSKAVPPDMAPRTKENATGKHIKAYEDTSDDENGSREIPGMAQVDSMGRQVGRLPTRRRKEKRGRIALSKDLKASAGERWRLVVSYNPPVL